MSTKPRATPGGDVQVERQPKLDKAFYEEELQRLQRELVKLQEWVRSEGLKVCVLLDKPARREQEIYADYVGYTAENLDRLDRALDHYRTKYGKHTK